MKALKILATFFASFALLLTVVAPVLAQGEPVKQNFVVSAYYSPLKGQDYYVTGSYAGDIRLNGRGTNGADGTQVYVGMLAAPKSYPFGTRIKIPGLGVGEVHDRGGAILEWNNAHRLDVWMGHGEEGLNRALKWGMRAVEGEVYFDPDQIESGLDYNWVSTELPPAYIAKLKQNTLKTTSNQAKVKPQSEPQPEPAEEVLTEAENKEIKRLEQNRTLLAAGLGKDSSGEEVENLQLMLWELGYLKKVTGQYDEPTIDAVFRLQIDHGVIQSEWDQGAGYFGKKTLGALLAAVERKIQVIAQYPKEVQAWVPASQVLPAVASLNLPEVTVERQLNFSEALLNKKVVHSSTEPVSSEVERIGMINLSSELDLDNRGDEVVKLQNFLIEQGHLAEGLNTGYFGQQTEVAVLKFQLKEGVIDSADSLGAGRVGPRTLATINSF